jgi:hypothetical protein
VGQSHFHRHRDEPERVSIHSRLPGWSHPLADPLEVLLKPVVRIDQFGAITWILPAVISAVIGTLLDVLVFFLCFRRKISRALFLALLLVNAFSLALAAYRLVAYVDAHPPEA